MSKAFARLVAAATLIGTAGCASTRIDHLAMTPTQEAAPRALVIDVAVDGSMDTQPAAQAAADTLRERLISRFDDAGFRVSISRTSPAAATMRVRITQARGGNRLHRFALGFGAGNATLVADVALELPQTRGPALRFTTTSGISKRPGLSLPGSITLAGGSAATLPISAGLGFIASGKSGLAQNADRSAKGIVAETRRHFDRMGWRWPSA